MCMIHIYSVCVIHLFMCVPRRLDVLRHSHSVSDGSFGGGAESAGAGQDPALVHHEAAERLPRPSQQACRHMLLLLGGSYARGTERWNRQTHRRTLACVNSFSSSVLAQIFCTFVQFSHGRRERFRKTADELWIICSIVDKRKIFTKLCVHPKTPVKKPFSMWVITMPGVHTCTHMIQKAELNSHE